MPHLSSAPHSVVIFTAFPDPSPVLFYPCVPFPCTQPFSPCSHCHFITPLPRSSFLPSPFLPACDPICFLENTIPLIESQNGWVERDPKAPQPHPCHELAAPQQLRLPRARFMASDTSKGGQPVPRPRHLLSKFYLHSFPGSFQSVQWQNKGQWAQTGT